MRLNISHNKRTIITVFITLLIICEMIAYVTTTPRPSEQFFQLYVLGADHSAAEYYPKNDSNIGIGEPVTWYLGVINNMGSVQLVSIRVKLSNETIEAPNDTQALESPAPVLTDFSRFLQDNETWEVPFVWSILNATSRVGSTRILVLEVDNETYMIPNWTATNGYNFRFTFELWTWQTETNAFEFGWGAGAERHVAWLQVWFNMVTPTLPPSP
jgi:hypothetical protein